jgi:hypothetical protein
MGGMALEVLDGDSAPRYSTLRRRSLIGMVARRALHRVNGSAGHAVVRPLVVMAARALGPGRTRLRLVKLAHNLDRQPFIADHVERFRDEVPASRPTTRAA